MSKDTNSLNNAFNRKQGKDKKLNFQLRKVLIALSKKPKTMRMVELETGINRNSICWRIYDLRRQNYLRFLYKDVCPISKRKNVNFYTTNKDLFPEVEPSKFKK